MVKFKQPRGLNCTLYPALRLILFGISLVVVLIFLHWGYTLPEAIGALGATASAALLAANRLLPSPNHSKCASPLAA